MIAAGTAVENVGAFATVEMITVGATAKGVIAALAEDRVATTTAVDRLACFAASDVVGEGGADHGLESRPFDFVDATAEGRDAVVSHGSRKIEINATLVVQRRQAFGSGGVEACDC